MKDNNICFSGYCPMRARTKSWCCCETLAPWVYMYIRTPKTINDKPSETRGSDWWWGARLRNMSCNISTVYLTTSMLIHNIHLPHCYYIVNMGLKYLQRNYRGLALTMLPSKILDWQGKVNYKRKLLLSYKLKRKGAEDQTWSRLAFAVSNHLVKQLHASSYLHVLPTAGQMALIMETSMLPPPILAWLHVRHYPPRKSCWYTMCNTRAVRSSDLNHVNTDHYMIWFTCNF